MLKDEIEKKSILKKDKKNKANSNKKNRDQIWHKNKWKSNIEEWNWNLNSIGKRAKNKQQ